MSYFACFLPYHWGCAPAPRTGWAVFQKWVFRLLPMGYGLTVAPDRSVAGCVASSDRTSCPSRSTARTGTGRSPTARSPTPARSPVGLKHRSQGARGDAWRSRFGYTSASNCAWAVARSRREANRSAPSALPSTYRSNHARNKTSASAGNAANSQPGTSVSAITCETLGS